MASEEPVLLQGCSERGINLCCPWQKLCLCLLLLPRADRGATHAAGKAHRAGDKAWRKPSEVSLHRDTIFSVGREGQCLSGHPPTGPSSVSGLTEDLGKTGAIPIMAIDVGMVSCKLGLASHGSCQAV